MTLAALALMVVIVLIATLRMTVSRSGIRRLYWAACSFLTGAGIAGLVYTAAFPAWHVHEAGYVVGEMPPEFGLAVVIVEAGLLGALAGFVAMGLTRLYRRIARRYR